KLVSILRNPKKIFLELGILSFVLLFLAFVFPKVHTNIGDMKEGEGFVINIQAKPGIKFSIIKEITAKVEDVVKQEKQIISFSSNIKGWSPKIEVNSLKKGANQIKLIKNLRKKSMPLQSEAFIYFEQNQKNKTKELLVEIYGYDYDNLKIISGEISNKFNKVQGLCDVKVSIVEGVPEWNIIINKDVASSFGMTLKYVADSIHAKIRGMRATKMYSHGKEKELVVRFQEQDRDDLKKIRALPLTTPSGFTVTLEQISDIKFSTGPGRILRKNKYRMMHVSATLEGISLDRAIEQITPLLKEIKFPKGYYYLFDEKYYSAVEGRKEMILSAVITILLIYIVLAAMFESYSAPLIIMSSIPLALIGVLLMCLVLNRDIQLGTIIGFILLSGVVVNTGTVLIDTMNSLRTKGKGLINSIIYACRMRFRPILATTITSILGLMPMIFASGSNDSLWSNLALTVIAGLSVSFFLTLFVAPCFYLVLAKK
ncbi:MAG: efflux RND transporter permease subunit, partial [Candidatus Omnitrophica bacterium]|nr:efflux RND transporter permease subunit [Candidatus Omnitrophota bacterium]